MADNRKVDQAVDEADEAIMELCDPENMTPVQAIAFLERVIERCNNGIEALREENDL